jgi:hypothetical protein
LPNCVKAVERKREAPLVDVGEYVRVVVGRRKCRHKGKRGHLKAVSIDIRSHGQSGRINKRQSEITHKLVIVWAHDSDLGVGKKENKENEMIRRTSNVSINVINSTAE